MMSDKMKAKREELKALSAGFKMLIKEGAIGSINEGLANYYAEQGHTTLNSYKRWKENGFQVKKGSKALLLWGEPAQKQQEQNAAAQGQEAPHDEETKNFFPVAYVFSNLQVEPIKNESNAG